MDHDTDVHELPPLWHVANRDIPCFACFLNELVYALNEVEADDSAQARAAEVEAVLQQIADGMARLFLAACHDADAQRAEFNARIAMQITLLIAPTGADKGH